MTTLLHRRTLTGAARSVTDVLNFTPPANPDAPDAEVSLGLTWSSSANGTWVGNRIRITDTAPGAGLITRAYTALGLLLATEPYVPVPGGYQDVMFASPVAIGAGILYVAMYITDRYADTGAYPWPATSTDGKLTTVGATPSAFDYGATPVLPANPTATNFYISPIVVFS